MILLSNTLYFTGETQTAERHLKDFLEMGSFKTVVEGFKMLWEKQPKPDLLVLERFRCAFAIVAPDKVDKCAIGALYAALKSVSDATNLLFACKGNYGELVEWMHANGVDLQAHVAETGLTPLHFAAQKGNQELAIWLIQNKAETDRKMDKFLWTPLHYAAFEGHDGIAGELVKAGADVNARTSEEDTPLHLAASKQRIVLCAKLALAGADATLVDSQGLKPIDLIVNPIVNVEKTGSKTIFSQVPEGVVRMILQKLPLSDVLSTRKVCREWNDLTIKHMLAEFKRLSSKGNSGSQAG